MYFVHQKYGTVTLNMVSLLELGFSLNGNSFLYCPEKLRNPFCVGEQFKRGTIYSTCIFLECVVPEKNGIPGDLTRGTSGTYIVPYWQLAFRLSSGYVDLVSSCNVQGGQTLVVFSTWHYNCKCKLKKWVLRNKPWYILCLSREHMQVKNVRVTILEQVRALCNPVSWLWRRQKGDAEVKM